jgi:hypothetical protein
MERITLCAFHTINLHDSFRTWNLKEGRVLKRNSFDFELGRDSAENQQRRATQQESKITKTSRQYTAIYSTTS